MTRSPQSESGTISDNGPASSLGALRAVNAFLQRLDSDLATGSLPPLAHYAALFPEGGEALAREYESVHLHLRRSADAETARSIGPYPVVRILGEGGWGKVYLCDDPGTGRRVAVKVLRPGRELSPESCDRIRREARLMGRVEHPNICPVYACGEVEGRPYIVMRCIDGLSLAAAIRKNPGVPVMTPAAAATCFSRVARALQAAHDQGVVHRDVTPGNILLDAGGIPYLTDFGMSRDVGRGETTVSLPGQILGTCAYMSPEQAAGGSSLDGRSDVFSLGAVVYEAITGRMPFGHGDVLSVLSQVINREVVRPRRLVRGMPGGLEAICLKALAKRPSDRYQSARELAEDFDRFASGNPVMAANIGTFTQALRLVRRHPARSFTAGIAVAAMILAAVARNGLDEEGSVRFQTESELIKEIQRDVDRLLAPQELRSEPKIGSKNATDLRVHLTDLLKVHAGRKRVESALRLDLARLCLESGEAGPGGFEEVVDPLIEDPEPKNDPAIKFLRARRALANGDHGHAANLLRSLVDSRGTKTGPGLSDDFLPAPARLQALHEVAGTLGEARELAEVGRNEVALGLGVLPGTSGDRLLLATAKGLRVFSRSGEEAPVRFPAALIVPHKKTTYETLVVVAEDLAGDARPDIVVVGVKSLRLLLLIQTDAGFDPAELLDLCAPGEPRVGSIPGSGEGVLVADTDLDGENEVVVAVNSEHRRIMKVRWHEKTADSPELISGFPGKEPEPWLERSDPNGLQRWKDGNGVVHLLVAEGPLGNDGRGLGLRDVVRSHPAGAWMEQSWRALGEIRAIARIPGPGDLVVTASGRDRQHANVLGEGVSYGFPPGLQIWRLGSKGSGIDLEDVWAFPECRGSRDTILSLHCADITGDGMPEVLSVVHGGDDRPFRLYCATLEDDRFLGNDPVMKLDEPWKYSLVMPDLDRDGVREIACVSGGRVRLFGGRSQGRGSDIRRPEPLPFEEHESAEGRGILGTPELILGDPLRARRKDGSVELLLVEGSSRPALLLPLEAGEEVQVRVRFRIPDSEGGAHGSIILEVPESSGGATTQRAGFEIATSSSQHTHRTIIRPIINQRPSDKDLNPLPGLDYEASLGCQVRNGRAHFSLVLREFYPGPPGTKVLAADSVEETVSPDLKAARLRISAEVEDPGGADAPEKNDAACLRIRIDDILVVKGSVRQKAPTPVEQIARVLALGPLHEARSSVDTIEEKALADRIRKGMGIMEACRLSPPPSLSSLIEEHRGNIESLRLILDVHPGPVDGGDGDEVLNLVRSLWESGGRWQRIAQSLGREFLPASGH